MSELRERVAEAMRDLARKRGIIKDWEEYADAAISAVMQDLEAPSEAVWGGLPRAIIMWMDMEPKTPDALFKHLERSGHEIPQWLRDEPEMKALNHTPSKGTRAVLVLKAFMHEYRKEAP